METLRMMIISPNFIQVDLIEQDLMHQKLNK